jgi:hypothetical protein
VSKKRPERPERAERRMQERVARGLVRDREKLALLEPGGTAERPIDVASSSVIEPRVRSMACPQCGGEYRLQEHAAPSAGLRRADVACRVCGVKRSIWFRLAPPEPN